MLTQRTVRVFVRENDLPFLRKTARIAEQRAISSLATELAGLTSKSTVHTMIQDQTTAQRGDLRNFLALPGSFALTMFVLIPVAQYLAVIGHINPAFLLLMVSPWVLGLLVLLVDRPNPLKFWLAPLILASIAPALALAHDWNVLSHSRGMTSTNRLVTLSINVLLIGSFSFYLAKMLPRRCPSCQRVALIPLVRLWGSTPRTSKTRWCSSCGGVYWRLRGGPWQKERRKTWLQDDPAGASAVGQAEPAAPCDGELSPEVA